jgi:hypothetical protein
MQDHHVSGPSGEIAVRQRGQKTEPGKFGIKAIFHSYPKYDAKNAPNVNFLGCRSFDGSANISLQTFVALPKDGSSISETSAVRSFLGIYEVAVRYGVIQKLIVSHRMQLGKTSRWNFRPRLP